MVIVLYRTSAFTHKCSARYWYSNSVILSVSVTCQFCVKTAKDISEVPSSSGVRIILDFSGLNPHSEILTGL